MTYPLNPEFINIIPTHFGPMCVTRQGPGGKKFAFNPDKRKRTTLTAVSYTHLRAHET